MKNKLMNKMVKKMVKKVEKESKDTLECKDKLCPIHGERKLKMRGRTFDGVIIKKLPGRVTIQFERMIKVPKYERYEKRRTKIHARLPDCIIAGVGDLVQVAETRPISKMIHFVVSNVIKKSMEASSNESKS
ncbi:MAG: 30S ribosomal protein S17 [archaeon]|nr:30S ribosomal protein S17 [archaeon]MCR4323950.1 30S ribosomal protein S17 [Nanoarchaeota archaeon]